jgi:hypothetical protein
MKTLPSGSPLGLCVAPNIATDCSCVVAKYLPMARSHARRRPSTPKAPVRPWSQPGRVLNTPGARRNVYWRWRQSFRSSGSPMASSAARSSRERSMARSSEPHDSATISSSLRSPHRATLHRTPPRRSTRPRCDRSRRARGAHHPAVAAASSERLSRIMRRAPHARL